MYALGVALETFGAGKGGPHLTRWSHPERMAKVGVRGLCTAKKKLTETTKLNCRPESGKPGAGKGGRRELSWNMQLASQLRGRAKKTAHFSAQAARQRICHLLFLGHPQKALMHYAPHPLGPMGNTSGTSLMGRCLIRTGIGPGIARTRFFVIEIDLALHKFH